MRHMLLIPASGAEPTLVEASTLEQMQALVGGWVERVRVGEEWSLAVDEEGRLKQGLRVNGVASILYGAHKHGVPIVGDVLLGKEALQGMEGLDWVDVTEEDARAWLDLAMLAKFSTEPGE